jgi:hypothetical protein
VAARPAGNGRDVRGRRRRQGSPHGSAEGAWRPFSAGNHHLAGVTACRWATAALEGRRIMPEWIWALFWVLLVIVALVAVLRLARRR